MSDVLERFMRYVQVGSPSNPDNMEETPSTPCQHDMALLLGEELRAVGCTDVTVDEHAYVTGTLPASAGAEGLPALMLCAHIDSSSDAPAMGVRPHVVRYEGGALVSGVVDGAPVQTTPDQVPDLARFAGEDIVCSDGTTLLSADDKAGVAEIVALLARLSANPELPHPAIKAAFVPDEEIGHGAELLDIEALGAAWGYTVDGEALGEFNYECFSASEATVTVRGVMVHPGAAKNIMVNAITVASEFQQMIPAAERPEHTEGREGYYHPTDIEGTASELTLTYILRDFDAEGFARREQTMRDVAAFLNARYGEGTVTVTIRGLSTRTLQVSNISFINQPDGYRAEAVTQSCSVQIRGSQEAVEAVTASQVRIVADLSEIQLATGSQTIPVRVYLDGGSDVGVVGEYNIVVSLTRE